MSDTSTLRLRIFDGTRHLFAAPAEFLVTITDGHQMQHIRDYFSNNELTFKGLPFFDNFGDSYTVIVWAKGYRQAGFTPVELSNSFTKELDVMLVSENPGFSFVNARWSAAKAAYPFLESDVENVADEARYDNLLDQKPKALACFLNIAEAMGQIDLADRTPLHYMKQLCWEAPHAPAQDRFFAWCDASLINQVKIAAAAGRFAVEHNPGTFHPGATSSWKQIDFGEANVQLTFHEHDTRSVGGIDCVLVEPDMDYFRDLAAHTILEVVPNALTNSLTDPVQVYVLRWIAGRTVRLPEFSPLYTIT